MAGHSQRKTMARNAAATARAGGYVEGVGRHSQTGKLVATSRSGAMLLSRATPSQKKSILANVNSGMKRRYR